MEKKDRVIAILLVVLIGLLFVGGQYKANREGFTKEAWVNYTGNSRQVILDDFVDRTSVGGMAPAEVEEMLGAPDDSPEGCMVYFLGRPRGLFGTKADSEDEFLLFHFKDGAVAQLEKATAVQLPKDSIYYPFAGGAPGDGKFYPEGAEGGGAK